MRFILGKFRIFRDIFRYGVSCFVFAGWVFGVFYGVRVWGDAVFLVEKFSVYCSSLLVFVGSIFLVIFFLECVVLRGLV